MLRFSLAELTIGPLSQRRLLVDPFVVVDFRCGLTDRSAASQGTFGPICLELEFWPVERWTWTSSARFSAQRTQRRAD